jgi:hypothetical protein
MNKIKVKHIISFIKARAKIDKKTFPYFFGLVVGNFAFILVLSAGVMIFWDFVIPEISTLETITYNQAFSLVILVNLLKKNIW